MRDESRIRTASGQATRRGGWGVLAGIILGFLAGCSSTPPVTVPAAPPSSPVSPAPSASEQPVAITSEPAGASVLVNNRLVGKTPLELRVKVSASGFCADYVTVKVRFVAEDAGHASRTVESELTPREKAPAKINFTPAGAQWRLK